MTTSKIVLSGRVPSIGDFCFVEMSVPSDLGSPASVLYSMAMDWSMKEGIAFFDQQKGEFADREVFKGINDDDLKMIENRIADIIAICVPPDPAPASIPEVAAATSTAPEAPAETPAVNSTTGLVNGEEDVGVGDLTKDHFRIDHILHLMVEASRSKDKMALLTLSDHLRLATAKWCSKLQKVSGVTEIDIERHFVKTFEDGEVEAPLPQGRLTPSPHRMRR